VILSLARRAAHRPAPYASRPDLQQRRAARSRRSRRSFWQMAAFWALVGLVAGLIASIALPSAGAPKVIERPLFNQDTPSPTQVQLDRSQQGIRDSLSGLQRAIATERANRILPAMFAGQRIDRVTLTGGEKVVALTFDDGPNPTYTRQILDILRRENAKATFFVIGRAAQAQPDLMRRIAAEGHEFGNHTWTHRMRFADSAIAAQEIDNTSALIHRLTGKTTRLYRPPGGTLNNGLDARARGLGYAVVMWSHDTFDWRRPTAAAIAQRAIANPQPGNIILMHDGGGDRRSTVAALPQIIQTLRQQGYRFVSVQELMTLKAQEAQAAQANPKQPTPAPANPT
jgi:peptidoglycan/xylan/chitin deacetylase (PgdA/CDA1 family)